MPTETTTPTQPTATADAEVSVDTSSSTTFEKASQVVEASIAKGSSALQENFSKASAALQENPTFTKASAAVVTSVEKVRAALEVLKTKVLENESVSSAAVKTNGLIEAARTQTQTALDNVRANVPASTTEALAQVSALLVEFKALTSEKYTQSLDSANQAIAKALEVVQTWKMFIVEFAMNRVSSLDSTFQLSSKTVEYLAIASEQTKLLDTKYNISENVENLTVKAKELDETYLIQQKTLDAAKKVQEIGDSLTGARITPLVEYVTDLAVQGYTTGVDGVKLVADVVVTNAAEQNSASVESKELVDSK